MSAPSLFFSGCQASHLPRTRSAGEEVVGREEMGRAKLSRFLAFFLSSQRRRKRVSPHLIFPPNCLLDKIEVFVIMPEGGHFFFFFLSLSLSLTRFPLKSAVAWRTTACGTRVETSFGHVRFNDAVASLGARTLQLPNKAKEENTPRLFMA
jgi:hypothetical protein